MPGNLFTRVLGIGQASSVAHKPHDRPCGVGAVAEVREGQAISPDIVFRARERCGASARQISGSWQCASRGRLSRIVSEPS